MLLYNDKTKVDKLSELKKELTELEQISLQNMDKVIERGEKIEVLVKKSEMMTDQSYDLKDTAKKVKNRMWWKNKKIMIGIILIVLALLGIVIWLIAKWPIHLIIIIVYRIIYKLVLGINSPNKYAGIKIKK